MAAWLNFEHRRERIGIACRIGESHTLTDAGQHGGLEMASSNERSDGRVRGSSADQGSHGQQVRRSGHQIALDIVETARQARELHTSNRSLSVNLETTSPSTSA
jgi:hypothetical protein